MIAKLLKGISLAAVLVLLSACAKLPLILVDQVGPDVISGSKNDSLYYSPSGPTDGSTQVQIINGFLYAGNGPQDDYAVARKFLTVDNTAKWHPSSETLIQSGDTTVVANSGTKIRLKVNFDARVALDGTYHSEPGSSRILDFRLLQENGQWRISSAPNLTILLKPNFSVLFKSIPIYFWDKSFSYLVPDVRWFPLRASLATRVTNALLSGPSPWLAPAVQSIFPSGTKLNINSVTVDVGLASIDFNSSILKVTAWKRPYLRSQLLASLSSVDGITQVSISVERTVQQIGVGASGMPENSSNLPVVLNQDGLSHIAGLSLFNIRGTKELVAKQNATKFAISSDETLVVLLGNGSVYSYNLGLLSNATHLIDDRAGLNNPSIDPFNNIWTTTKRAGSVIRITDVNGNQVSLANPFGKKSVIRDISVSPEGSRLAILHSPIQGISVDVLAIVRDKNRKVIGLGSPQPLAEFGPKSQEISWVDHTNLTSLVSDARGDQTTLQAMVGGPSSVGLRTFAGLNTVTIVGGSQYYLDSSGVLYVSKALGWDHLLSSVSSLRMAGQ
jgi:hypothetical protein